MMESDNGGETRDFRVPEAPIMERRERVRQVRVGGSVDRVPISFWWHSFTKENEAESLAEETAEQFRRYDWDLIKLQSRATAFAEGGP